MSDITKIILGVVTVFAIMAGCSVKVASAHTGGVTCGTTGVVFSYQNNFAHDTAVTETVNGVGKTYTVKANTASIDTIPATGSYQAAKASWKDGNAVGSIPLTELSCPYTPPTDTITVCIPTETVTKTIYTPGPETIKYIPYEVPGPVQYKTKIKWKIKWHTRIKLVEWHPKPKKHNTPGVAG